MIYKKHIQEYLCKKFWIRHKILIHAVALISIILLSYFGVITSIKTIVLLLVFSPIAYNFLVKSEILNYIYKQGEILDEAICENELPSSTYLFEFLLNKSPVIIYYEDINNNILYKNEQAKIFLETYNLEELKSDFSIKEPITFKKTLESNQQISKFNVFKYPICDKKQNLVAMCTIAQDISLLELIKQQRQMYIAIIMHDLKTPVLAQIRSLKKILKNKSFLNNEQVELLKLTLDSCNYVYKMLSVFLNTCKLANEIQLNYEECDLNLLLETSCQNLQNDVITKNITFNILSTQNSKCIAGDKEQLLFAISSLLKLSLTYSYENTVISINISSNQNKNHKIEIISCGPSFNTSLLENLLRDDISDTSKYNRIGEGLELYLTRQIIKAHNGNINVENINGESKNIVICFETKSLISL